MRDPLLPVSLMSAGSGWCALVFSIQSEQLYREPNSEPSAAVRTSAIFDTEEAV